MKKFLLRIALFFVLVAVFDVLCGWTFDWLRTKARGGMTLKNQYISEQCEDDILILGSSKAAHHYIPQIISDSLGLSCYNCGQEGNGIVAAYARYKMVSQRHKPKMVLYEVTPEYDYLQDKGYSSYLGVIRQNTDNKDVKKEYLDFSDNLEVLRLKSNMYCNNSRIIGILKDCFRPIKYFDGYEPLFGSMGSLKEQDNNKASESSIEIDSLKYNLLERLMVECINDKVSLVFVVSPSVSKNKTNYFPAIELCETHGIPFLNNMTCDFINENGDYFQDPTHLNNNGATIYTQNIVKQLKTYLIEN